MSKVENLLTSLLALVSDYQNQVKQVRQQTTALKAKVFAWITPAAILVSVVSFWIAVSQLCIMSRSWSWIRQPARNSAGTE
jgi:hypothetical protein